MKKTAGFLLIFFLLITPVLLDANDNLVQNKLPEPVKWNSELRELIYDDEDILHDGSHIIELTTPYRAADAAIVPISVKFKNKQNKDNFVKNITLIVDENPSPVVGKFHLSHNSGYADFSTRIRIDKYTYVRVIAEMNNNEKYMVSEFVKAAGGCSAPSLADMDTVMARLGKMKMKLIKTGKIGALNKAQFIISHPNFSGLQFNQLTRTEIPAHFVDTVTIKQKTFGASGNTTIPAIPNGATGKFTVNGDVTQTTFTGGVGSTTGLASYTALSSSTALLELGFDKFQMPLVGGSDGVNIREADPFANRVLSSSLRSDRSSS